MPNLYLTADAIDPNTGAGKVVYHESEALKTLGPCEVWERTTLDHGHGQNPWLWDEVALYCTASLLYDLISDIDFREKSERSLAHCYAGTFSKTVARLQEHGYKVTYTAAAHSVDVSRREHHRCGLPYDYPHLTDPEQFKNYLAGYKEADVLICPSHHSAGVMRGFGCDQRIEVIPHGVDVPMCSACREKERYVRSEQFIVDREKDGATFTVAHAEQAFAISQLGQCEQCVSPLPARFIVGYTGSYGPDKGVIYLLQAWRKLNYPDAVLLLGGRDSTSMYVASLIERFGGGNISLLGWLDNVSDFYRQISLYVQPSASEGFGCEVLEAAAHGRPVIASEGCGAADILQPQMRFTACDVDALCYKIEMAKNDPEHFRLIQNSAWPGRNAWDLTEFGKAARCIATNYTWDKIRSRYVEVWKSLLGGK